MARVTHHPRRPLRVALIAACAVLATLLAACGSGGGAAKNQAGNYDITAGVVPAMPAAAVYVGLKDDLFAKHGVALAAKPAQTGAAVLASLLNGEQQVGYISTVVALTAISQGAPVRFAAGGDVVPTDTSEQMYGGLVFKGTAITDYKQLEGMTVAVNALHGIDNLAVDAAVDQAGGDPSKVKIVEVPYPEQWSAVSSGRVDAAVMSDPFFTDALAQGATTYGNILATIGAGALVSSYIVTDKYAQQAPDAVAGFVAAMDEASSLSNSKPDLVREVIPQFSQIPAAEAAKVTLPHFSGALQADAIQKVIDLMVKYGYISKPLTASDLLAQ